MEITLIVFGLLVTILATIKTIDSLIELRAIRKRMR